MSVLRQINVSHRQLLNFMPMGASNCYPALMHSGVFNVLHELRSADVGLADDRMPAEIGHSSAG